MSMYGIMHEYGVDDGCDYPDLKSDIIAIFPTREIAERYVEKWANPHCYDKPYVGLWCGDLYVVELPEVFGEQDVDRSPSELCPDVGWAFDPTDKNYCELERGDDDD